MFCKLCIEERKIYNLMNYIGVLYHHDVLYYAYECTKTHKVVKERRIILKGKDKTEQVLDESDLDILNYRIKCPRSNKHSTKDKNHQYIHVKAKGISGRFYCSSHTPRYEFRSKNYCNLTLRDLLEDIDMYTQILNIKEKRIEYSIRKDEDNILELLYFMHIPQCIIANIFNTTQSTVSRCIKTLNIPRIDVLVSIENKDKIFDSFVKIDQDDYDTYINLINEKILSYNSTEENIEI